MKYTVVFEEAPDNYAAYVPDLPGCVAVAKTRRKVKVLIREATRYRMTSPDLPPALRL